MATAIRLATAFLINKVVAVVAGPAGMVLIGPVQNIMAIVQGISSGVLNNAAVKYTAEWRDFPQRRNRFLSLSFTIAFWASVAIGTAVVAISWILARTLLNNASLWWVFTLLGLCLPMIAMNNLLISAINGLGLVRKLTRVNIIQSLFGLVIAIALPLQFGLPGALAATVLATGLVFVLVAAEFRRQEWAHLKSIDWATDREDIHRIGRFVSMAVTAAVCAPLAQLLVREWIVERCSVAEAGYWQALMRFSGAYLAFFTTTLSVYFLPRFSSLDAAGIRVELRRGYGILLPAMTAVFAGVWLSRGWLIPLLFSQEFKGIDSLLIYQLVGDFLKLGSWILSYVMLGRAQARLFMVSEILFSLAYVVLAVLLVGADGSGGARGALLAWIGLYAGYWAFLGVAIRKTLSAATRHEEGGEAVRPDSGTI